MILHALLLATACGLLAPLGAAALLLTGTWGRLGPVARLVAAPAVGIPAYVVVVPPLLYLGLSPTPWVVLPASAALLAAGLAVDRHRRPSTPDEIGGALLVAAALLPGLALLAARAVVSVIWRFDAFSLWSLKAVMLHGHGGRLRGALDPRVFASDVYAHSHREYPLGLPSLEAWDLNVMHAADTRVLHLQFVANLAGFLVLVWLLLRPHVGALPLGAALVAVSWLPQLREALLSGYADTTVAGLWVVAALAVGLWASGDGDDRLALGVLFAAAALALKGEGMLFDLALFGLAALGLVVRRERHRLRALAAAGAVTAATAVPWQAYVRAHGLGRSDLDPSLGRLRDQAGNVPDALPALVRALVVADGWLYVVPIAVVAACAMLVRGRRRGLAAAYLATLAALTAALVVVYWIETIALSALLPLLLEGALGSDPLVPAGRDTTADADRALPRAPVVPGVAPPAVRGSG